MRAKARQLISVENLKAEYTPFTFPLKDGHSTTEIRNVPMAYIVDLWTKIEDMLTLNDNSTTGYVLHSLCNIGK